MRSSTWIAIIGVTVLTMAILLFTGTIQIPVKNVEESTDTSTSSAKTVKYVLQEVENDAVPTAEKQYELVEK